MEKNIVIIGKNGSNKSCRAEEISNQFKNNEVIYVSAIDRNSFDELLFMRCTQETKLIIIDIRKKNFALIYMTYNEIITIKKKGFEQFKISPKFIFVCDEKINKEAFKGASLLQRFEIIDMETYTMKRCEMIEEPKMSNGCYGFL